MDRQITTFDDDFAALTGVEPFHWQRRLFLRLMEEDVPGGLDLPTGLGKTSVIAIWLIARAHGAKLPRRLVYVVDRRAVVDQATEEAEKLRRRLEETVNLKVKLGLGARRLPISTLRGRFVDNREWLEDPSALAIVVGTVDMIGSRLLFEGYGVSRKMRPYQAGLLGIDALIVLDEAHLTPPFAHLLRAVEQDSSFRPSDQADREHLPSFVFLPLSATQRDLDKDEQRREPFRLEEKDWTTDSVVQRRLEAKKRLHLEPLVEKDQDMQLACAAWALAMKDGKCSRVAVFCDRRAKKDDGGGPSAEGVAEAIQHLARADKKAGRAQRDLHPPELLVGSRRVRERELAAEGLRSLGFIGEKKSLDKPAFLVATSAGEVGVDIDADHMVSDLVAWERMVQRLGRVNRRGEGDAEIQVFWGTPSIRDVEDPAEHEKRALTASASKAVIESLREVDASFDVSPGALRQLTERARSDPALKSRIDAATTPEPLRPALSRALVDAWSMTSLEIHTGRPDVAPWLRGWVDETPQMTIIWRTYLPIRLDVGGRPLRPDKAEIEAFFEAAPPHESEKLDTETYRVVAWLQERSSVVLGRKQPSLEVDVESEDSEAAADDRDAEQPTEVPLQAGKLQRDDIVALSLSSNGSYAGYYTLSDLIQERKGKAEELRSALVGKILVVDARLGGMMNGQLSADSDDPFETADNTEEWSKETQFRVRRRRLTPNGEQVHEEKEDEWRFEGDFDLDRNEEGKPVEQLVVEHFRDGAQKEDARSISGMPQELSEHQEWAAGQAKQLIQRVPIAGFAADALVLATSLHDEGKSAERWQRAFTAPREKDEHGAFRIFAKTRGPINKEILGHYRHEFGSLRHVEDNAEFKVLPHDCREFVLHLVAAHHGHARPMIETRGCEDGPPSLLEERARAVALRFAQLQKRWGPWGLAWWEALLRAADQQASRANEEGQALSARGGA